MNLLLKQIKRIAAIKQELMELGEMRSGTLSQQYNVCGNPTCRCKDPENPKKHGLYYQLSYTRHKKSKTEFVKKEMVATVKQQIKNYKRFIELMEEWIDLSIEIAQLKKTEKKSA
jgi:hypothetical protein